MNDKNKDINKNMIGRDYYKVKDSLPNKGMRSIKNIYNKQILIGVDKARGHKYPIYLECKIKVVI